MKSLIKKLKSPERSSSPVANPASALLHGNSHSGVPHLQTKVSSHSLSTTVSVNDDTISQSSGRLSTSPSLSPPLAVQPSVSPSPDQSSTSHPPPAIIILPSDSITEAAPATIATEETPETPAPSFPPAITISPSVSTIEAALATIAVEAEVPETPAPPLNLWKEAFESVNDETKRWIQEHGLNSTEQSQPGGQIKELIALLKSKTLAEDNDTPSKIVIGDRRIVLREHVTEVVSLLTMAGDIAMNFAPPQASAPWAIGKALLKVRLLTVYELYPIY